MPAATLAVLVASLAYMVWATRDVRSGTDRLGRCPVCDDALEPETNVCPTCGTPAREGG